MQETFVELQPAHRRKLWLNVSWALAFPFLAGGMFYFTLHWVGGDQFILTLPIFFKVFLGLMGLAMLGVVGFIAAKSFMDLRRGEARVIQGIVSDKRKEITTKTTSHYSGRGNSSSTSTSTSNFIFIEGVKFKVEQSAFSAVRTGDRVELVMAPHSEIQLDFRVLERQAAELPKGSMAQLFDTTTEEVFLDEEDRTLLKRWLTRRLKRRLMYIALPSFIQLGLLTNGLWGMTIFLFPLYIVMIWQIVGAMRSYLAYRKVLTDDRKSIHQSVITDKSLTTNNGKPSYMLFLDRQAIVVSEEVYGIAEVTRPISLHYYGSIKTPLAVTFQSQVYHLIG